MTAVLFVSGDLAFSSTELVFDDGESVFGGRASDFGSADQRVDARPPIITEVITAAKVV